MVSAITERPYTFLRWLTGTLPGRKPLRRTLSFRSTRRASALASRSDAGTLILNSCFNPSTRVSVTCMASIFFRFVGPDGPDIVQLDRRAAPKACVGGSADPLPQGGNRPSSIRHANAWIERLVRAEGLEPPQLSSLEPKSSASTSSATPA